MITLQGKGVFGGIAIGEIAFFKRDSGVVQRKKVEDPQAEIQRFENAKAKAIEELGELYDKAVSEVGESNAMLFQTHQFMLEDLDYVEAIENMIQTQSVNAEYAVSVTGDNFSQMFASMDDDYMRERAADVKDISARVVKILTGAGEKSFVAGADIGEMSTLTKAEGEAFGKTGNDVFRKIETFPIPVIAAVNGFALGGGCEISMSCDIRICSENAIFGQPEVGLGITPGFGGTQRLARIVGVGKAKEMIYTAFNIKAEEAYRIGLVNAVYPQEELLAAAKKLANKIASNAPIAVRACKKAINEGLQVDMDQAIVVEEKAFGSCFETEDQKAGMGNFLEKDKAKKLKVVPFQNK